MTTAARITSGSCRIKANYRNGSGDRGKSNLVVGTNCNKSGSSLTNLYSSNWKFVRDVDVLLEEGLYYLNEEEAEVFSWIRRNFFSLSSFAFLNGVSDKHTLPKSFLNYLDKNIEAMSLSIGDAKDFLIWKGKSGILFESLIISSRDLEVAFQSLDLEWSAEVSLTSQILNRLSTWLFWLGREIYRRNGLTEDYWQGQIEEFPF